MLTDIWGPAGAQSPNSSFTLLIVCEGNICRSPFVEHVLKKRVSEEGVSFPCQISSAGTKAVVDHPIEDRIARHLTALGVDPETHRSRQLSPSISNAADLILTMTKDQRDSVVALYPRKLRSTFSIGEFTALLPLVQSPATGSSSASDLKSRVTTLSAHRHLAKHETGLDVRDPFRQSDKTVQEVVQQLCDLCENIGDKFFGKQ